jgi:hypothetical protein
MNSRATVRCWTTPEILTREPSPETALEEGPSLNMAILYEDRETGLRAKRTSDRLAARLPWERPTHVHLWRFDLLRQPALCTEVANAAVRADVVLLSAHGQHGLPEAVSTWLTGWLGRQSDAPPALVLLLDAAAEQTAPARQMLGWLQAAAAKAGVDLFFNFGELTGRADYGSFAELQRRAETTTTILAETLRRSGTYLTDY